MTAIRKPARGAATLLFVILSATAASAADFQIKPRLTVSEEFTDNVFTAPAGERRHDFITRAMPGIDLQYRAPYLQWDSGYTFDYRYYARGSRSDDTTHSADVAATLTVLQNFLYIKASDTYRRVSLDTSRDTTQESLFVDQTDSNTAIVSPYAAWKIGERGSASVGYRYTNIWYSDPEAVDRDSHAGFATAGYQISPKAAVHGTYSFTRVFQNEEETKRNDGLYSRYDRHDAGVGGNMEIAPNTVLTAEGGATAIAYHGGGTSKNPYWTVSLVRQGEILTVKLTTSQKYEEDPLRNLRRTTSYGLDGEMKVARGIFGGMVSYRDYSGDGSTNEPTKIYTVGARARYDLTRRLVGNLSCSGENFFTSYMSNSPRRIIGEAGLVYRLFPTVWLSASWRVVDSFSKTDEDDNYRVNRVIVEVRKTF